MNKIQKIWLAGMLLLLVGICACAFREGGKTEETFGKAQEGLSEYNRITDLDRNISGENAVEILLDAGEKASWGEGVSFQDGRLVITKGGTYYLRGSMNGSLILRAQEDEWIHLVLDGFEIYSAGEPALCVESAEKVILTASEGSMNIFSDSAYRDENFEKDSCIYSAVDLTFNGAGTIQVCGYYKDAIASKDLIKFVSGDYSIKTVDDGIRGRDGIAVADGHFDIQTEGDGLKSTNTGNEKKGDICIFGGELEIISGGHAMNAAGNLQISGCRITMQTILEDLLWKGQLELDEDCVDENYE